MNALKAAFLGFVFAARALARVRCSRWLCMIAFPNSKGRIGSRNELPIRLDQAVSERKIPAYTQNTRLKLEPLPDVGLIKKVYAEVDGHTPRRRALGIFLLARHLNRIPHRVIGERAK
jgi:hypothetical protein